MPSSVIVQGLTAAAAASTYHALRAHLRSIHGDTMRSSAAITTEDSLNIVFNVEDIEDEEMVQAIQSVSLEDCTVIVCQKQEAVVEEKVEEKTEEPQAEAVEDAAPAAEVAAAAPVSGKRRRRF